MPNNNQENISTFSKLLKFIISVAIGALSTLVTTLVLIAIFLLIYGATGQYDVSVAEFGFWSYVLLAISALIGGFISGKLYKKRGILLGVCVSILLSVVIVLIGSILEPGTNLAGKTFILFFLLTVFTSAGAIIAVNKNKK